MSQHCNYQMRLEYLHDTRHLSHFEIIHLLSGYVCFSYYTLHLIKADLSMILFS